MLFRLYCIYMVDEALWSLYNTGTVVPLVNLLHAIIRVLKLSLVLHELTVLLGFYLILICQVLTLFRITAALFSYVLG